MAPTTALARVVVLTSLLAVVGATRHASPRLGRAPIAMRSRMAMSSPKEGPLQSARELWEAVRIPNFETDTSPSAKALRDRLAELQRESDAYVAAGKTRQRETDEVVDELREVGGLMLDYYKDKLGDMVTNEKVRSSIPKLGTAFNVAFVLIILRVVLPRLLALETIGDLEDNLGFLGIPTRAELSTYLSAVAALPLPLKLAGFIGTVVLEKVLCVTEFIPLGIILPTISPLLFGGIAQGVLVSATASATGATVNFYLGRRLLKERIQGFSLFGGEPVGETAWFRAVNSNFEKAGFKTALMLRLAPILPIPIDSHWYLCGTTSLQPAPFVAAQLLGALKACLIDAYFGSLLLANYVGGSQAGLPSQTKWVVTVEVVALILASVLVTNAATTTLEELLREEGWERSTLLGGAGEELESGDPSANEVASGTVGLEGPAADTAAPASSAMIRDDAAADAKRADTL